jgi:hypothetical protein
MLQSIPENTSFDSNATYRAESCKRWALKTGVLNEKAAHPTRLKSAAKADSN